MPDKITMELGRPDSTPAKAKNVETKKTQEFLKTQIKESTPGSVSQGNSLKVTEQGKMEEVRENLLNSYPPEKTTWVEQEIPFPKEETPAPVKTEKKLPRFLKNVKKKLLMTLGLITLAGGAKATDNNAEKEFNKNSNTIEHINKDPGGGERKVEKAPPGYVKYGKPEGKTQKQKWIKETKGTSEELKPAKPGDGKGGAEYEKWLMSILKSGKYTPEELVEKGYMKSEAIEEYRKYYTPPSLDIVYTEVEESKEADPFSAYAKDGEQIWGTNRHLIAILSVPVRDTKSITESGNINTSNSEHMVLVRFVDKMGKPTGECVEIKTGDIQDYFGTTMTMQSDDLMKELKGKVKKNSTYVATAEDFATNK